MDKVINVFEDFSEICNGDCMRKIFKRSLVIAMGIGLSLTAYASDTIDDNAVVFVKNIGNSKLIAVNKSGHVIEGDEITKTWDDYGVGFDEDVKVLDVQYQPHQASDSLKDHPVLKIIYDNGYVATYDVENYNFSTDLNSGNEAHWFEKNAKFFNMSPYYQASSNVGDYINFYVTATGAIYIRYYLLTNGYGLDPLKSDVFDSAVVKMVYKYDTSGSKPEFANEFKFPKSLYAILENGVVAKVDIPQGLNSDNKWNYFFGDENGKKAKGLSVQAVDTAIQNMNPQDIAVYGGADSHSAGVVVAGKDKLYFSEETPGKREIVNLPHQSTGVDNTEFVTFDNGIDNVATYVLQDIKDSNDIYLYDVSTCQSYGYGLKAPCVIEKNHQGFDDNFSYVYPKVMGAGKVVVVGFESGAVRYYNPLTGAWTDIQGKDALHVGSSVVDISTDDNNLLYISYANGMVAQYIFDTNKYQIIKEGVQGTLKFSELRVQDATKDVAKLTFSAINTEDQQVDGVTYSYEVYKGDDKVDSGEGLSAGEHSIKLSGAGQYTVYVTAKATGYSTLTNSQEINVSATQKVLNLEDIQISNITKSGFEFTIPAARDVNGNVVIGVKYDYVVEDAGGTVVKSDSVTEVKAIDVEGLSAGGNYKVTVTADAEGYGKTSQSSEVRTDGYNFVVYNAIYSNITSNSISWSSNGAILDPADPSEAAVNRVFGYEVVNNSSGEKVSKIIGDNFKNTTIGGLQSNTSYTVTIYFSADMYNKYENSLTFTTK